MFYFLIFNFVIILLIKRRTYDGTCKCWDRTGGFGQEEKSWDRYPQESSRQIYPCRYQQQLEGKRG